MFLGNGIEVVTNYRSEYHNLSTLGATTDVVFMINANSFEITITGWCLVISQKSSLDGHFSY